MLGTLEVQVGLSGVWEEANLGCSMTPGKRYIPFGLGNMIGDLK